MEFYRRGWAFNLEKASIGIGTMIILIAMILITTSNNLEIPIYRAGQEKKDEMS